MRRRQNVGGGSATPANAYAALGRGRCLRALRDTEAEVRLREARSPVALTGNAPHSPETEALLGDAEAAAG